MSLVVSLALFAFGLGLVLFFAEQLVKGVVGACAGFGISPFLISVVFTRLLCFGADPDLERGCVGNVALT